MEYVGQLNIKRLCNFYVSDLHLSVMLLPYISKQIDEDVEITTIFEKIDKADIEKILDKLNIKNKNEVLNINWFNSSKDSDNDIIKNVENSIKNNRKINIIIGGSKDYILENNKKIKECFKDIHSNADIKIIDCYDVEEVEKEMKDIVKNYEVILNTSGEFKLGEK